MELATLFTEQRWNILKHLSDEKLSPLQLANITNTTIANISQQLRLLEAANLIKKERLPNRDKGQPRTLFSLSEDYAYLILITDKFAGKKLVKLSRNHIHLLKILSIDNAAQREKILEAYLQIREHIGSIHAMAVDSSSTNADLLVAADNKISGKLARIEGIRLLTDEKLKEHVKKSDAANLIIIHWLI
ncbi:MAG TPA: helix-turn-helix domain-containing protein [Candidatus Nanoarchaeia archaeon]|nr:helix-turn-helix domain-containing protein [Candidatus Nanoarchaeia archaeon]